MSNYQYTGCVTGVTEGGTTQLIQPTEMLMPVVRDANAYSERLVGVALLLSDSDNDGDDTLTKACPTAASDFICIPTDYDYSLVNTDALTLIDNYARYRIDCGDWVDYVGDASDPYPVYNFFASIISVLTLSNYAGDEYTGPFPLLGLGSGYVSPQDDFRANGFTGSEAFPYAFTIFNNNRVMGFKSELGRQTVTVENNETVSIGTVDEIATTCVEFVVSEGVGIDLVQALFGGDYTAMSCGRGTDFG